MPWAEAENDDIKINPIPAKNGVYKAVHLMTSGGVDNLNVNGSVTPVNFDFTPAAGETWYLKRLIFFFRDDNLNYALTNFGNLSSLTNGIELRARTLGTEYLIDTLQTNIDVFHAFKEHDSYLTQTNGLGNDSVFMGEWQLTHPIKLQNSTSDYVRMRVRDNLTSVFAIQVRALLWGVID